MAALGLLLFSGHGAAQVQPALSDKAAAFFDDTKVHEIRLYFDSPNWYQTLLQAHSSNPADPYFPAKLVSGDTTLEKIGVRFKGNSSFRRNGIKKPFKLDFNEFDDSVRFFGLKKLNLHNFDLSPDFMREKLFQDFAGLYVAALRCTYVRLYVNDQFYGLYLGVEQPDKTMMQSRYGSDEDGNLYEAEEAMGGTRRTNLVWQGEDPGPYQASYILKTNETKNDYSGLIEFINVLNNVPASALREQLEPLADVRNLLSALAVNNLLVNMDSYIGVGAEYYLYDRMSDGRFVYIQWDTNESFGTTGDGTPRIADPARMSAFWLPSGSGNVTSANARPLMEKLWAVPEYRRMYLRLLARMLRDGFNPDAMAVRIEQLANLIRDHVYEDPNKAYSAAQFETALNSRVSSGNLTLFGVNEFVKARFDYMRPWLNQQAQAGDVRLNELVVFNDGASTDEAGDPDPWLEIHNLGPGPWNLGTLSLTDDPDSPGKWVLPARTLADGGYQVLWLDGETEEGETHAPFRPQASGGKLYLYTRSGDSFALLDEVEYPALTDSSAYARFTEMDRVWATSNRPTPGADNLESLIVPPPAAIVVKINELMASNTRTLANFEDPSAFDDWIELYNAGNEDVDLGGMYLTDNPDRPTKWRIPEGVKIPAGGYLIFWADEKTALGPLHAGFKLSADGEAVVLVDRDGSTVIDSIVFGKQTADVSFGRTPDGGETWTLQSAPTPGRPNAGG